MTLLSNRANVRTNLKIDPQKKIWSDATLTRFINEGQRWIVNDPAMNWGFAETNGYMIPVQGYQEYRTSTDDNPETYFSSDIRQLLRARASNGNTIVFGDLPEFVQNPATDPSMITEYAQNFFLNAGYQEAATYTTLHNMDTYDGDGTWAGTNDATNVATDAVTFKEGAGSVSFDIDVSNSTANKATLTNSTFTAVDLSGEDINTGGIILWVYLDDFTYIKSTEVKFGSSSTAYYAVKSYAKDVQGIKYKDGWNRIFIPTLNKQTVGSPDTSAIDYLQVNIEFSSSAADQTSCRIDGIEFVDKYIEYWYTRKATDLSADSDESAIPSQYQFVYELYATSKALNTITGKEEQANKFMAEAKAQKNIMIEELAYNIPLTFSMPPR
jgi:hypothetical protein